MDDKDIDSEINKDNESENNDDSDRQINPLGSAVVQQSLKGAVIGKKNTNLGIDEEVVTEGQGGTSPNSVAGVGDDKGTIAQKTKLTGSTTTTKSKSYTKTTNETGTSESTTEGTTTTTTETPSTATKLDDMLSNAQKVSSLVTSLNTLRNSSVELGINYEELIYFQRMVRPLIDSTYFLALSAQGVALTAQALNGINVAKVKQVEASVDLAYDFVKELDCILQVLKCRLDTYLTLVEKDGCNTLL